MSDPNRGSGGLGFSVITGTTVARIIEEDIEGCINIVRDAYLAHHHGRSVNPSSVFLRFKDKPNARVIALPSHLDAPWHATGIKWIASYPDNTRIGLPRASAVSILNNAETGYPFACLEASIISAARTAGSAALAAEFLCQNGRYVQNLSIIGTGFIARYVYRFVTKTGWRIDRVQLFDLDTTSANRFATNVCDLSRHSSVSLASDIGSAISRADLVLFTTTAGKPHVHDAVWLKHCPLVLHISLRDLAPELLLDACNVVDDVDHVMNADTSLHLAEKLTGTRSFVRGTLAEVIEGKWSPDNGKPVIFSPFGLGILDLAVAKWIYDQAAVRQELLTIQGFFHDLER
jgi:N-[(2S)-2-amino-2-carboxyethyl]-L-glutamate dehydrogenase